MKTDKKGHPIGFYLTGGEASDSRNFETLLDIGPDIAPRAVVADKGYDAAANREAARERGVSPLSRTGRTPRRSRSFSPRSSIKAARASSRHSAN